MRNRFLIVCSIVGCIIFNHSKAQIVKGNCLYFSFADTLILPGTTFDVFKVITGDIKPWWDHSFSKNPYQLFLEPKVNGGFFEFFDEQGNGVKHATVTG